MVVKSVIEAFAFQFQGNRLNLTIGICNFCKNPIKMNKINIEAVEVDC